MGNYQKTLKEISSKPKTWLVTGAAGFIGSALCEQLLRSEQTVVGLDNFSTGHRKNLSEVQRLVGPEASKRFSFIEGDICDFQTCKQATKGVDIVLHQAALGSVPRSVEFPLASHAANVDGFLNVGMACVENKVGRLVFASSSSVYGDNTDLPKIEHATGKALSPYAATKQIDELYAGVLQKTYGLECVGLRYFNVFGRRQDPNGPYAAVIPKWLGQLFKGDNCKIFGDGTNSRDFCYIDNTVQANLLAGLCNTDGTGQIYNVGCGARTDLNQLFNVLKEHATSHDSVAASVIATQEAPRVGDVPHSQASIDKIKKNLGYEPSHDISSGLKETVLWYAQAHKISESQAS